MAEQDTAPETDQIPGALHPRETPQLFGQDRAERTFLDAWANNHLHHAWLIRGPGGVGKATLAYRIARAILADGPGNDPAGLFGDAAGAPTSLDVPPECAIAPRIRAGAEPRLAVLRLGVQARTGKPRTQIVVDDVRAMKSFLHLSAADGGWRVVLVDAVDQMNRSAANALLKMLEEPPAKTLMLLVSHAPGSLLPTIRSRCRFLDLDPLNPEDLAKALAQQETDIPAGSEAALAELAAGSVGRALWLISGNGLNLYSRIVEVITTGKVDRSAMVALAAQTNGRDGVATFSLIADLVQVMMSRMARTAATGMKPQAVSTHEITVMAKLASNPAQARLWANAAARTGDSMRHAMAVNLDPGQTIIDTFLDLDTTLGQARHTA
ncbi:MAG: DNA polymerase III subunit delta' [Pseudomonadota bacterium]